jgi:hypothetical protein
VSSQRYFTPEQANELLPAVRPLVERLVEHRRALAEAQQARESLVGRIGGNGDLRGGGYAELIEIDRTIGRKLSGIARCVNGINELGALVKDLDSGLVDFPARLGGEDVLLCWQLGEERIEFWHGPEEGYAGRKPLEGDAEGELPR